MFQRTVICGLVLVAACGSKPPAASSSSEPLSNNVPVDAASVGANARPTAAGDSGVGAAAGLKLTGLDPVLGDVGGGTYVVIKGENFIKDGPRNVKVYFGSRQGTVVRFQSDRELIVQAPGGKPNETVDVLLIFDPGGQLKLPSAFKFVDTQPPPTMP